MVDTILPQEPLPVPDRADQGNGARKEGFGMVIKGDGGSFTAQLICQRTAFLQQRLVAQMDSVEKTQGKNPLGFSHIITSFSNIWFIVLAGQYTCLPLWGRWLSIAKPERAFCTLSVKNHRFLPALPEGEPRAQ